MPIYLHVSNLIIPKDVIVKKYKNGIAAFRDKYITESQPENQKDKHLFSIASMNPDEFDIQDLMNNGLQFNNKRPDSPDFVIVTRHGGLAWPVDWIDQNSVFAWHINTNPEQIAKAHEVANLTVDGIQKIFEEGKNPFKTIP